jgi:hypothetical protein
LSAVACHRFSQASLLAVGGAPNVDEHCAEHREQARGEKAAASRRTQKLSRSRESIGQQSSAEADFCPCGISPEILLEAAGLEIRAPRYLADVARCSG